MEMKDHFVDYEGKCPAHQKTDLGFDKSCNKAFEFRCDVMVSDVRCYNRVPPFRIQRTRRKPEIDSALGPTLTAPLRATACVKLQHRNMK
ncbi:hypothetical protein ABVT39_005392 [Epinephelus coioides]